MDKKPINEFKSVKKTFLAYNDALTNPKNIRLFVDYRSNIIIC